MFGFININKPPGVTSRAVVNKVERLSGSFKVGHSGTLDPIATGVLVLGIGSATRLLEYVQQMPKSYRGTFLLGQSSETLDTEGEVSVITDSPEPPLNAISKNLEKFTGTILQRPPQYSAIKVKGRRAYDIARSGKRVALSPREVTIYSIEIVRYQYPELSLDIKCSRGTYIRALGRDLAKQLDTSAVMSSLCRTAVGDFKVSQSITLSTLQEDLIPKILLPPHLAVTHLNHLDLSSDQALEISHGRKISIKNDQQLKSSADPVAAFYDGSLAAIIRSQGPVEWLPHKVFLPTTSMTDVSGRV